ncbi:MAG: bifunctional methylenetetrahydrofolate dehydrogenase/methenyltetrahydrofolate cyclohydrolase FolD [Nanoarchaeota archaeon]|nr:bifunctional methylenetetrahydrofolate dehydrogenase/methenyltetrahydrofolate cyclohydrolase FolD [Nanoarchaeota archaeon]MBU1269986.1 bifunctional methylenetetrahydrofolate dehydrogenase/methenyltetrahydrofolate cyclohydrolase FolD [Nanoarchaeota archaeon]MBU1604408.1 bifunctional methylenetetrahydrofolate dehydrogenase/methenyltetrahydrofolate cyclohydrolase FolD [Nanoarchaeota archaeon]MBU2442584.1 bifunctional methylenetetrahydrofolate dehydrogenase/methenyltetrahydrofolate cyclohydrolase
MYEIIDGRKVAGELREKIKKEVLMLDSKPGLAVILIGNNPASQIYVNLKTKMCKEVGINSYKYELDKDTSQEQLLELIDKLNHDNNINGILVQLPLPKQISQNKIVETVLPKKDVDGFHPVNQGKLLLNEQGLQACTPRGTMKLLKYYNIDLVGKDVVVIGRSVIVGKPVAQMLTNENATVTICHSKTRDLKSHTLKADIIVSAVGKKNLVTADMVKEGVVVVDVGMIRDGDRLCGDVDFENVKEKCSFITPVPGGVGPMTIACLLENTLAAYKMQRGEKFGS